MKIVDHQLKYVYYILSLQNYPKIQKSQIKFQISNYLNECRMNELCFPRFKNPFV